MALDHWRHKYPSWALIYKSRNFFSPCGPWACSHGCTCDNRPGCYFLTWLLAWSWSWEGGVLNEVSKLFYPACKCHRKMEKTDLLLAWGLKLQLTDETDCLLIHWLIVFSLGPAKKHEWRTWLVMVESSDFIWYSVNIMFLDEAWLPERELLTCLNTIHSVTIPKQHALHRSRPLMAQNSWYYFDKWRHPFQWTNNREVVVHPHPWRHNSIIQQAQLIGSVRTKIFLMHLSEFPIPQNSHTREWLFL